MRDQDIRIERDDLTREVVHALLSEHLDDMAATSPAESMHALDLDGLRRPDVACWTAWSGHDLLGFGALKHLDDTHGEIKSMRTATDARGRGVGASLLRHLVDEARRRGYTRLSLETGSQDHFVPARRLYARHGFVECPPFGPYVPDPNSVFMTRDLRGETTDRIAWHDDDADPSSAWSRRLRVVQRRVREWLDATAPSPVTVVSVCAGDGRDLLEVLADRDDAGRVTATLLEADPTNARRAECHARSAGLTGVQVRCVDAGTTTAYTGAVPADLVLLCGVFGSVTDEDVRRTVAAAPQLCTRGAYVIWTRNRREPDLTPGVRAWFGENGFEEVDFVEPDDALWSVGVQRYAGSPLPLGRDRRLFTFVR